MCGICGEIHNDEQSSTIDTIQMMNAALQPRGPGAGGIFTQGNRAFGHRRLKIIDLTEHAQQPMIDNELGLGIIFNENLYIHSRFEPQVITRKFYAECVEIGFQFDCGV